MLAFQSTVERRKLSHADERLERIEMKITDIRTAVIAANFPWNLIRIYTDSGLVGLGEAYWGPGVTDVVEKLKPRLVGEDPMEVDRLWTRMMRLMSGPGSIAGTTVAAISGIEIALLDLRNASVSRSVERSDSSSNVPPIEIHRGLLALTVQLPTGSDAGLYEVVIRDSNQQPIRMTKGEAKIENGITKLSIDVDTRSIRPGKYAFTWRSVDFDWREYPAVIR